MVSSKSHVFNWSDGLIKVVIELALYMRSPLHFQLAPSEVEVDVMVDRMESDHQAIMESDLNKVTAYGP